VISSLRVRNIWKASGIENAVMVRLPTANEIWLKYLWFLKLKR